MQVNQEHEVVTGEKHINTNGSAMDVEMPPLDSKIGQLLSKKLQELVDETIVDETTVDDVDDKSVNLKFRNYTPHDPILQKKMKQQVMSAEEKTDELLRILIRPLLESSNTNEIQLIPQKLNWDLEREVASRLEILNKRTEKALAEILQEKIKEEEEEEDDDDEEEDEE